MSLKHFNIQIFGGVQGVSFRFGAREKAIALGLAGIAENKPDGSLYIEIEGETEKLREFINWCGKGPRFSKIERVVVNEGAMKKYSSFEIL